MKSAKLLIDLAREKVQPQTDAELARHLHVPRNHVTEWRAGRRPMSPACIAALCDLLQLSADEAREWLAISVVENAKAGKVEVLRRAFFVSWMACVAAALTGLTTDATARTGTTRRLDEGSSLAARCLDGLHIVAGWARSAANRAVAAFSAARQYRHVPPVAATRSRGPQDWPLRLLAGAPRPHHRTALATNRRGLP